MIMSIDDDDKRELETKGVIKVPASLLGVFIFMTAQTFGAIWWASYVNTTMGYMIKEQQSLKTLVENNTKNRYTSIEADKDKDVTHRRIDKMEIKVDGLQKDIIELKVKTGTPINLKELGNGTK